MVSPLAPMVVEILLSQDKRLQRTAGKWFTGKPKVSLRKDFGMLFVITMAKIAITAQIKKER